MREGLASKEPLTFSMRLARNGPREGGSWLISVSCMTGGRGEQWKLSSLLSWPRLDMLSRSSCCSLESGYIREVKQYTSSTSVSDLERTVVSFSLLTSLAPTADQNSCSSSGLRITSCRSRSKKDGFRIRIRIQWPSGSRYLKNIWKCQKLLILASNYSTGTVRYCSFQSTMC